MLFGGAVAVIPGRSLAEIDRHLQLGDQLPAAGVHGAERRGADGLVRRVAVGWLDEALAGIDTLAQRHPRLRAERKPGAIALHYRQAPQLEDKCIAAMTEAARRMDGMALILGNKVVELKSRRANNGAVLPSFLDQRPFRHRRPWFFGDDVTDEAAFETVQSLGGVAVRIGEGDTLAAHRRPDPASMHDWLARAADHLAGGRVERVAP